MKNRLAAMPYLTGFAAIAGITAGMAAGFESDALKEAFHALGEISGSGLLKLSFRTVLLDGMLYFAGAAPKGKRVQQLLAAACIWFKMYIMGCFIMSSFETLPFLAALLLAVLTLLGGIAVCSAVLVGSRMPKADAVYPAVRLKQYLFAAGIAVDGIVLPGAAKLLSLLVG